MKRRIAVWASIGFLVACCWIIFSFAAPREYVHTVMGEPGVQAVAVASCPVAMAGWYFPVPFWLVALANAATYGLIGLMMEVVRRRANPSLAV